MTRTVTLDQILALVDGEPIVRVARGSPSVTGIARTDLAEHDDLVFIAEERDDQAALLAHTRAGIVVCHRDLDVPAEAAERTTVIGVDRPRLVFARIANALFGPEPVSGIHATASVDERASIGDDAFVGANAVIGAATIGAQVTIGANCTIADGTTIGDRVRIGPNTTVGEDGFGYVWTDEAGWEPFPHAARVVIDDDVHIGASCCVDRGALSDTVIGAGTRIDNLVQVAHNCVIGRHVIVAASATICGSVTIGDRAYVSPGATLRDRIDVGERAFVGLGAIVTRSVEAGQTVLGGQARRAPAQLRDTGG